MDSEVIVGKPTAVTVNAVPAVPPPVVSSTVPVTCGAVEGTTTVASESLNTVQVAASDPLTRTAVALVKFAPLIVMTSPAIPEVLLKLEIVGGVWVTLNE
jgi:hypothetical protein